MSLSFLSGKAKRLINLPDEMCEQWDKVLIFTQFREMGDLLQQFIISSFLLPYHFQYVTFYLFLVRIYGKNSPHFMVSS